LIFSVPKTKMIVCYFAKSELNKADWEHIRELKNIHGDFRLYVDSLTTVNVLDIEFERILNWREVEVRNRLMTCLDQLIDSVKKSEFYCLLLDSLRYEILLKSNLSLHIHDLFNRFVLAGESKKLVIFLDVVNVYPQLPVFSKFDKRISFHGYQKRKSLHTLVSGISKDFKFLISYLRTKRPSTSIKLPPVLFVEAFAKNKRFFEGLFSYLRESKHQIKIVYPLVELKRSPHKEHELLPVSSFLVCATCLLILPFYRILNWLSVTNSFASFVRNLVYTNHNGFLQEIFSILFFRNYNQDKLNHTNTVITTSNASAFVRACVFANPKKRSITVQHGHMTFFGFERNLLCKEFWVWGEYYERKLREFGYLGVIRLIGNPSRPERELETKVKTLQNKITYYPSTVGGSAISREGSISLANDINHASQFFMDVNWHVKYKSKTDRELLKDCLKYFAEDIDILSSIASSDILIVTTSSVLIDGLVEGKRIIIYNPDQLFNTEHYADLSELPGILIAESLNELLASLAILNVKNIEQEIEINPQSRLFVKYRDRKSSEEMYHAIESDLTFNEE
jgi:hypothetical protein